MPFAASTDSPRTLSPDLKHPLLPGENPPPPVSYATALLGILIGTLAAILLVPSDYFEPGQLRAAAVCMALGLLVGPLASSLTDLRGWLRAESVMMIGLVYWLLTELLYPSYDAYEITRDGVLRAFLYMGLFSAAIQIGSLLAHRWHSQISPLRPSTNEFSDRWLFNVLIYSSLLGMLSKLVPCDFSPACMVDGLFSGRADGPWQQSVTGGSLVYQLAYFGYLSLPLTVALHHRVGRIDWRVVIGLILSTIFLLFLIRDGGRRLVGMVTGAALLTWLLLQPRIGLRQFAIGGVAGVALLALLEMMLVFRTSEGGIVSRLFSGRAFEENPLDEGIRVDNNFKFLVKTLDLIPEFMPHTGWDAIIYWAGRPIPRALWPGKPINPGIDLPWELGERWGEGFTLTVSAIGDWYVAFGLVSILLAGLMMGFLGGKLVLHWMRPTVRNTVLYSLGAMCLFIGLRSYLELILMSYPILALLLFSKLTSWLPDSRLPFTRSLRR